MRLEVRGHPVHTRALGVTLSEREDGRVSATGYVLDLRKRGVVPIASDLQGPGVIHNMLVDAVIDRRTRILDEIGVRQPTVAIEPSAVTGGESCRDPAARIEALRGTVLDGEHARRLSGAIGGPRGCSHVLTLSQLLGSTARWALDHDGGEARRGGERLFRRDITVDGHEPESQRMELALQLTDLHFAPSAALVQPMDRFGAHYELRGLLRVDLTTLCIDDVAIGERRRGIDELDADWRERDDLAAIVAGRSIMRGLNPAILAHAAEHPTDSPAYDALLMLAPAMLQCFAALSDGWLAAARNTDSIIGMGGMPDSCYMWRRGGALDKTRKPGDPSPIL